MGQIMLVCGLTVSKLWATHHCKSLRPNIMSAMQLGKEFNSHDRQPGAAWTSFGFLAFDSIGTAPSPQPLLIPSSCPTIPSKVSAGNSYGR